MEADGKSVAITRLLEFEQFRDSSDFQIIVRLI